MLLIVAMIALILLPLTYFLSPKRYRTLITSFMAIAIVAPLGLIAPGFAFGEGSPDDVKAAFGYVPAGLRQLSGFFSAPFAGYNVPISFFNDANAPLWRTAIGYEISGIVGILLIGAIAFGIGKLLLRFNKRTLLDEQEEQHDPGKHNPAGNPA